MSGFSALMRICPLGGFGQIGMNCLALVCEGRVLVIDCGIMFPPSPHFGIDVIHPSFAYLKEMEQRIDGVVLTHGHEDHLAGLPFLLDTVHPPIYGGPYTLALLRSRLREHPKVKGPRLHPIYPEQSFQAGVFRITPVSMPHSIPDNFGLLIETSAGRIFHSGDFKLNLSDSDGGAPLIQRLSSLAPVDLLIADSTGIEERGHAGSEESLRDSLADLARGCSGRFHVAIFSSNVSRMAIVADIARSLGRSLVLAGRSVRSHYQAAVEAGKLSSFGSLLTEPDALANQPRNQAIVLLSGTQGEERSALERVSRGAHRHLSIVSGDTVVFSSRFIPGNELAIGATIDRLIAAGASVFTVRNHPGVHVSGHGYRDETETLIKCVRPTRYLPAHGTLRHLNEARLLGLSLGVETHMLENGDAGVLSDAGFTVETGVNPVGAVHIDGGRAISDELIATRRLLGRHGLLMVFLSADPATDVQVDLLGVVEEESIFVITDRIINWINELRGELTLDEQADVSLMSDMIRRRLRKRMLRQTGREPFVAVIVRN